LVTVGVELTVGVEILLTADVEAFGGLTGALLLFKAVGDRFTLIVFATSGSDCPAHPDKTTAIKIEMIADNARIFSLIIILILNKQILSEQREFV
jgi:hypothetical protein